MNKKNLQILLLTVFVLGALFYFSEENPNNKIAEQQQNLLSALSLKDVAKVEVSRGAETTTLAQTNNGWVVVEGSGYAADRAKINSLLLKLFDISTSQVLPMDENSLSALGLKEESVKDSTTRIRFLNSEDKELESVYLGELRKSKDDPLQGGGQFVRSNDPKSAYLVSQPIYVDTAVRSWLDVNVLNILKSRVLSVQRCEIESCDSNVELELVRQPGENGTWKYSLTGSTEDPNSVGVSQLVSGLENFRLSGVMPVTEDVASELEFNTRLIYKIENGLVYNIDLASQGEKQFAKISVKFDQELANKLTAEATAKQKEQEESAAQKEESTDDDKESKPVEKPKMSNLKDAEATNSIYQNWIYEIESFQANKLKVSKEELLKKSSSDQG
jgi:hypothetical protein